MDLLIPVAQEIEKMADPDCGANDNVWEDFSANLIDDMYMLYNTGKRHKASKKTKWNRDSFLSHFVDLVQVEYFMSNFVDMLYAGYCRGYDGADGKFYC